MFNYTNMTSFAFSSYKIVVTSIIFVTYKCDALYLFLTLIINYSYFNTKKINIIKIIT